MIPTYITKALAMVIIPKVVNDLYDWATGVTPPKEEPKKKKTGRKEHDTTPLTQYHFDYILEAYERYKAHNRTCKKGNKKTLDDLTVVLNRNMGLNKSRSAYSRVWRGKLKRVDLAAGNPSLFDNTK